MSPQEKMAALAAMFKNNQAPEQHAAPKLNPMYVPTMAPRDVKIPGLGEPVDPVAAAAMKQNPNEAYANFDAKQYVADKLGQPKFQNINSALKPKRDIANAPDMGGSGKIELDPDDENPLD